MNPKNRTFLIIGAVIALIVIAAGIAVVATGGDNFEADDDVVEVEAEVEQTRPIDPSGDPLPPYDETTTDLAVGTASPVVDGQSFDGTAMTIGGPGDSPTLLVFLAHWCPHCNDEIPELIELEERGDIPDELDVVGISTSVAADRPNYPPSEWIDDTGWPWPTMADDAQSSAMGYFGGTTFPYLLMLDSDGTVLARQSGASPADQIKAWIDATLATASA